jgi:hypothetical protein
MAGFLLDASSPQGVRSYSVPRIDWTGNKEHELTQVEAFAEQQLRTKGYSGFDDPAKHQPGCVQMVTSG